MKRKEISSENTKKESTQKKKKISDEIKSEPVIKEEIKSGVKTEKSASLIKKDTIFDSISESTPSENFPKLFDQLAETVINESVLVVCGKKLRFREIEFYVNHPNHKDIYTHSDPDQKRAGFWYFHKIGKAYRGGTYKGLDISIGGSNFYGGILLRSLLNIESGEIIEGSCLCVDNIIKIIQKAYPGTDSIQQIVEHANFKEKVLDQTGMIHIEKLPDKQEKYKTYKGPRVGLGAKCPEFLNKLYRYVVLPAKVKKGKETLVKSLVEQGIFHIF